MNPEFGPPAADPEHECEVLGAAMKMLIYADALESEDILIYTDPEYREKAIRELDERMGYY